MKKSKRFCFLLCAAALLLGGALSASATVVTDGDIVLPTFRNATLGGAGSYTGGYTYVDYYTGYNVKRIYAFTQTHTGGRSGTVYIEEMGTGVITAHSSASVGKLMSCYIGNDLVTFDERTVHVRINI